MSPIEICLEEELHVRASDLATLRQVGLWKRTLAAGQPLDLTLRTRAYAPHLNPGDKAEVRRCEAVELRRGDLIMCFLGERIGFCRVQDAYPREAIIETTGFDSDGQRICVLTSQVLGRVEPMVRPTLLGTLTGTVRKLSAALGALGGAHRA